MQGQRLERVPCFLRFAMMPLQNDIPCWSHVLMSALQYVARLYVRGRARSDQPTNACGSTEWKSCITLAGAVQHLLSCKFWNDDSRCDRSFNTAHQRDPTVSARTKLKLNCAPVGSPQNPKNAMLYNETWQRMVTVEHCQYALTAILRAGLQLMGFVGCVSIF